MCRRKAAASIPSSSTFRWIRRTFCSSAAERSWGSRTSSPGDWAARASASEPWSRNSRDRSLGELLSQVTADDLIEFGLIPEFVGRLPVLAPLDPLDEEAMIRILTEPKNALVRQYQKLFEMEGAEVEFELNALKEIARLAKARDTGARGLRAIVEDVMLDVMYDLPEMEHKGKHVITAEVVRGERKLAEKKPGKKSA